MAPSHGRLPGLSRIRPYPGAFRAAAGVRSDELFPLRPGETVALTGGGTASLWSERLRLEGAEAVAAYTEGPLTGVPAVTRHAYGEGTTWYRATRPDPVTLAALLTRIRTEAGVEPVRTAPDGVKVVRRRSPSADYLFRIDHGGAGGEVTVAADAVELLTGRPTPGAVTPGPGEIAMVREPRPS
ncbi:hypothetical protein F9278_45400 [Streptomyces phaeolivaceus]|uniref:Beta-galactosidase trimerisation domain-containing protein n=1 Tax=Streptomyces phaeolivaceus TaxID=2653200 RepID=A0A5P8KK23_9ACTN|nr:hypothetical protein F9278_45400 [Streptomyces phaeolivaceus]